MIERDVIIDDIKDLINLPNLNKDYASYLDGKRVILVGPAEYNRNSKNGKFFDSFDVVVRISNAYEYYPFPNDLTEDIGSKCDILYIHHELIKQHIFGEKVRTKKFFLDFCKKTNIKFFTLANQENTFNQQYIPAPDCHPSTRTAAKNFVNLLDTNNIDAKLNVVDELSKISRKWCQGKYFGTGFQAILDIMCYNVKELYVTGMTFYHGGGHMFHSLEGFDCKNLVPTKNYKNQPVLGQDTKNDLNVMKLLYKEFGGSKIEIDDSMKKLLGV